MKLVELKNDIKYYNNFLSNEECESIIKYFHMLIEKNKIEWSPISFYESYAMGFFHEDNDLLELGLPSNYLMQLKEKVKQASEEAMGRKIKEVGFHAQKWIEGAYANFHSDNSDHDGNYNAFEKSKYAAFIYLNEDFEGGILNFKNFDISIKPKKGMLAVFDGGHENEHEVTKVTSGVRYTIGSFWDYEEAEYSKEKVEQWELEISELRKQQEQDRKNWGIK
jgi:predicted 2-oxoglutarate/Fe(II)-dependent dioxygenase YbiX